MPKDIHVEPQRFAAQLISRLETVLREREAQERLEERLKRVRLVSRLPAVAAPAVVRAAWANPDPFYTHSPTSVACRKKRGTMLTSP